MFTNFAHRSKKLELMDDAGIGYDAFCDCLHDLERVNVLSFGYRPTLKWFSHIYNWLKPAHPLVIIDVGSGGGDTLRQLAKQAAHRKKSVTLTGVDLNPWSKQYADSVTPPRLNIHFATSDIFTFNPVHNADFVICSLFTHHLDDEAVVGFLKWLERHSRHGWFINDLHRHPVAYFLIKYLSRLFRFHYMVQNDGPISVARAFTKSDWIKYLQAANIPADQVTIRWFFPFRYCIERRQP
jgi:2-polyprenyl-3-methyl-5-hydroxy-6-metoxy-1,4-benzoquinol methylase